MKWPKSDKKEKPFFQQIKFETMFWKGETHFSFERTV